MADHEINNDVDVFFTKVKLSGGELGTTKKVAKGCFSEVTLCLKCFKTKFEDELNHLKTY